MASKLSAPPRHRGRRTPHAWAVGPARCRDAREYARDDGLVQRSGPTSWRTSAGRGADTGLRDVVDRAAVASRRARGRLRIHDADLARSSCPAVSRARCRRSKGPRCLARSRRHRRRRDRCAPRLVDRCTHVLRRWLVLGHRSRVRRSRRCEPLLRQLGREPAARVLDRMAPSLDLRLRERPRLHAIAGAHRPRRDVVALPAVPTNCGR